MDLLGCISLSNWTGENIQSYEPQNTLMLLTIFCEELTFHETHVGLERQRVGEPRTSSGATDSVQCDESLEIRDLRWFAKALQGSCRRLSGEMVDEDAER